jgi:uncharacterized membrane protein YraQ (UPF0718 family)
LIEVFVKPDWLALILPKRSSFSIMLAAMGGLVLPVCECAVVPVTRRLIRKGLPVPAAMAYLLAAPIVNPLVIASTVVAYAGDWKMAILRTAGGFVIAVLTALILGPMIAKHLTLSTANDATDQHDHHASEETCGCHDHEHEHHHHHEHNQPSLWTRIAGALSHATNDFLLVGQFLVIGSLIASLIHTCLNRQDILILSDAPVLSTLATMAGALGLNLCSEADAFVAASFRSLLPFVAQLAFLVIGPMMDIKLAAMYLTFMKKQAVVRVVLTLIILVFAYAMLIHTMVL